MTLNRSIFTGFSGNFEVPVFTMVLKGDPYEGEQAIVSLNLNRFAVKFESTAAYEKNLEVRLASAFWVLPIGLD
jgi:hypothetical protein